MTPRAVLTNDGATRAFSIVAATTAGLSLANLYALSPLDARRGAAPLRSMGEETREQRLRKLARAEEILRENAARAEGRRSWALRLGSVVLNVAGGRIIWAAGDSTLGIISATSGIVGGEVLFWTEPRQAARDLEAYERSHADRPARAAPSWRVVRVPHGLGVEVPF